MPAARRRRPRHFPVLLSLSGQRVVQAPRLTFGRLRRRRTNSLPRPLLTSRSDRPPPAAPDSLAGPEAPAREPADLPPLTEMVQREAALVRGPRLEALGTEVHSRRHDGGDAHRTQACRESAEHVERRARRASPSARAPPLPGPAPASWPRPSRRKSRPSGLRMRKREPREVQQLAQGHTASVPNKPQSTRTGWPSWSVCIGVPAGLFPMGAQGPLKVLTSRGGSVDELPGAAQDHGNFISLSSGGLTS